MFWDSLSWWSTKAQKLFDVFASVLMVLPSIDLISWKPLFLKFLIISVSWKEKSSRKRNEDETFTTKLNCVFRWGLWYNCSVKKYYLKFYRKSTKLRKIFVTVDHCPLTMVKTTFDTHVIHVATGEARRNQQHIGGFTESWKWQEDYLLWIFRTRGLYICGRVVHLLRILPSWS